MLKSIASWSDGPQCSERDIKDFLDRVNSHIKRGEVTHLTFEDLTNKQGRPATYQENELHRKRAIKKLKDMVESGEVKFTPISPA